MTITAAAPVAQGLVHGTYAVTMTNGSATRELVLTGSQGVVWVWCCRAGETRGSDLEGFVPVAIRPAAFLESSRACTCDRDSEQYAMSCPVHGLLDCVRI